MSETVNIIGMENGLGTFDLQVISEPVDDGPFGMEVGKVAVLDGLSQQLATGVDHHVVHQFLDDRPFGHVLHVVLLRLRTCHSTKSIHRSSIESNLLFNHSFI